MKVDIRIPEHFKPYRSEEVYFNLTPKIYWEVVDFIRNKPLSAAITAWNYFGIVWWQDELGYWGIEIWQKNQWIATYMQEDLEDLLREVRAAYGKK